jgi:hypothetical protein
VRQDLQRDDGDGALSHPQAAALVISVVALLAHGCPVQAIVAAFAPDERTVAAWQRRAGRHAARRAPERVHTHLVQADELRVRVVGGVVRLAMAISVTGRLWLGGVVGATRDRALIRAVLLRVRAGGPLATLLLCTDGLISYPRQALRCFRQPAPTGQRGRPRLILPPGMLIARAIKRYSQRRVRAVGRRIIRGSAAAVAAVNTAYIARLNATFRARLAPLVRRGRATVHRVVRLEAGGWLVGRVHNFCAPHRSLGERTPAQAAGLSDHRWTVHALLTFPVPLPQVKRRGRPPHWLREVARAA